MPATRNQDLSLTEIQSLLMVEIKRTVSDSPLNRLVALDSSPMFEEPLVGFADGDDPIFELFKQVVAEYHRTPRQALEMHLASLGDSAPDVKCQVGVVSWILPIAKNTRLSNRAMKMGPSVSWTYTRFQGEDFNESLRRHVVAYLEEAGYQAVAPAIDSHFRTEHSKWGEASNWSERHIAHACGLGTFGLSDGLITARGKAHRCGSVVVNLAWPATPRPYVNHRQYCLAVSDGSCGECIKRCPAGAISLNGHDKVLCRQYMFETIQDWLKKPGYSAPFMPCGLCQTKVPCEARIPPRPKHP